MAVSVLTPVLAHGVGGRSDLPLPLWQVAFGAGVAVVLSFAIAVIVVDRPRLARLAVGRPLPIGLDRVLTRVLGPVLRVLGLGLLVVVILSGLLGAERSPDFPVATNIAPVAFYIVLWQYGQAASAVFGNVWSVLSPYETLGLLGERLGIVRRPDAESAPTSSSSTAAPSTWPAFVGIGGFLWLELAWYDTTDIRMLGAVILGYSVWVMANVVRSGRSWLQRGEGFTVLFGLLAAMAPFFRGDDGRLRIRWPLTGLALVRVPTSTSLLILTVLGATSFDGYTRTEHWDGIVGDATGWAATGWATAGLLVFVALAVALFLGACALSARLTGDRAVAVLDDHAPSLIPITLGYTVAHYFSNAVFEGQGFWRALSDPAGQGWDLFGSADHRIDYLVVSTRLIAWVQVGAIVIGHVLAVLASHDRAL
ncbi:MAG: hypothetical protein MUE34_08705, partial [Acidimicrobiales bacterium]|nr:hypothetical protein [Acidimicrobiales bacterium]